MSSFLNRYVNQYLSAKVIFAMDVMLSLLSSVITITLIILVPALHYPTSQYTGMYLLAGIIVYALSEWIIKPYNNAIRHMTIQNVVQLTLVALCKTLLLTVVVIIMNPGFIEGIFMIIFDFFCTVFFLVICRVAMTMFFNYYRARLKKEMNTIEVMIYGTGAKAVSLVTRLTTSQQYSVKSFVSVQPVTKGLLLCDKPVLYFDEYEDFRRYVERNNIDALLFAHESDARSESDGLVKFCYQNRIKVLVAPSVDEIIDGRVMQNKVRDVRIEDLLGRDEIKINMEKIKADFEGKVVLVTGAAGSIGSELVRQLATFNVRQIILFDNAETPMHNLRLELEGRFPQLDFVPVIGDVRLPARLDFVFRKWRPQIVFHAAAYKHVPLMEENPCEAVLVNVLGSRNVADKCIEYNAEKMVMISTDKAVNPTNIMGCTKRLAEIYVQSLGLALENGSVKGNTKFVTTRFGNVLGSNGSVIPRFREQIQKGGPVTVTHPDIVRFFMTIPEACRLVMEAATMTQGNQIFAFDMGKPVKIVTLARKMIELAGFQPDVDIKIEYTGLRPGEKLFEEVLSNAENTIPTAHNRIFIARVRKYEYEEVVVNNKELERMSRNVEIPEMVQLMKAIVPEFISKNSAFSIYDKTVCEGGGRDKRIDFFLERG